MPYPWDSLGDTYIPKKTIGLTHQTPRGRWILMEGFFGHLGIKFVVLDGFWPEQGGVGEGKGRGNSNSHTPDPKGSVDKLVFRNDLSRDLEKYSMHLLIE